jgi:hypothetical protein
MVPGAGMTRILVLWVALMFIVGFAYLAFVGVVEQGLGAAGIISILILIVLAVGIVGALRNPPR